MMIERLDPLDRVLESHAAALGEDFHAFRNHTCRVRLRTNPLSPIPVLKW
jgi:hypothetical protein